jgi:hypothetical protein
LCRAASTRLRSCSNDSLPSGVRGKMNVVKPFPWRIIMSDREMAEKLLAGRHYLLEPEITEIRTLCSGSAYEATEPIKLLEVNPNTIASGIMPLRFDAIPGSGINFPSVIVEITPDEYEQIKRKELSLPNGWTLGPILPRPGSCSD